MAARLAPNGAGMTVSLQAVNVTVRVPGAAPAALFEPQPALHELTDLGQLDSRHRLRLDQPAPLFGTDREHQLEVLAVAQGVLQGRAPVLHPPGGVADRDRLGPQDRPAATLLA